MTRTENGGRPKGDYSNFRKSIDINFGEHSGYAGDIDDKYYLGILMQRRDANSRRHKEKRFYFNAGYKYNKKEQKFVMKKDAQSIAKHRRQQNKLLDEAWDVVTGKTKTSYHTAIKPRGFRKRQVRDTRTGRIVGWLY